MDELEQGAPELEPETSPGPAGEGPQITEEDRERGYRIGKWGDLPNYIELDGPLATLDEAHMKRHIAAKRRTRRN